MNTKPTITRTITRTITPLALAAFLLSGAVFLNDPSGHGAKQLHAEHHGDPAGSGADRANIHSQ